MGLLESFLIQFTTEGLKEMPKDVKNADSALDELEKTATDTEQATDKLGEATKKLGDKAKDAEKEITQFQKSLEKAGSKAFGAKGLTKFLFQSIKAFSPYILAFKTIGATLANVHLASELGSVAEQAGVAFDSLENLALAVQRYGGNAKEIAAQSATFNEALADIHKGGTGSGLKEITTKYGISTNVADADAFFEEIATKMGQLKTDAQKMQLSKDLGLDPATFALVKGGLENYRKELEKANKYKVFTKEDVERAKQYEMNMRDIRMGFTAINQSLTSALLPIMILISKAIRNVVDFFVDHADFIKVFLTVLAVALLPTIATAFWGIATAVWAALAPVLPFIAAIVAVALVIEDLWKWIKGEDSIAGLLFGDFETFKNNFIAGWNNIVSNVKNGFNSFVEGLKNILNVAQNVFNTIKEWIGSVIAKIRGIWDAIPEPIKAVLAGSNPITAGISLVGKAKDVISGASNAPLNSVNSNTLSNAYSNNSNSNSIKIGDVKIETQATNGNEVGAGFMNYIKRAAINLDNGMKA